MIQDSLLEAKEHSPTIILFIPKSLNPDPVLKNKEITGLNFFAEGKRNFPRY